MGDYTPMAGHYDLIMTSGYYDYGAIVEAVLATMDAGTACGADRPQVRSVVELGAGTGLVLERLVAARPDLDLAGVDLTEAMLEIAAGRLAGHPRVSLHRQDVVHLQLERTFDLAFSYGGVWYFVPGPDGPTLISHLRDDEANERALHRVAGHLTPGARLLLGVQAPHHDYTTPVRGGLRYSQRIAPLTDGFRKHYRLDTGAGDADPLMEQTTDYRTYPNCQALELLDKAGFCPRDPAAGTPGLFCEFERR